MNTEVGGGLYMYSHNQLMSNYSHILVNMHPYHITFQNGVSGSLEFGMNEVLLNATNSTVCFSVIFPNDNEECDGVRIFTVKLTWTSDPDYRVVFHQQNITITVDDCKKSV